MDLPRYALLKSVSNGKYLSYRKKKRNMNGGQRDGLLQFVGDKFESPLAKFEVELAAAESDEKQQLVHIKCYYNNKYWEAKSSSSDQNQWWIVASAESNASPGTLFKPVVYDCDKHQNKEKRVRFFDVQHKRYVRLSSRDDGLMLGSETPNSNEDQADDDVFVVVDCESLAILPRHVAFKGDNGQYLSARWIKGHPHLQFSSDDTGDEKVRNEIFHNGDGSVSIWSHSHQKFWGHIGNWVWAYSDSQGSRTNNADASFEALKVDDKVIALRNLGTRNFCKRFTLDDKESDCLSDRAPNITREARLQVEELVISRTIYNVDFDLADAIIHDHTPVMMGSTECENPSKQTNSFVLKLAYTDAKTSTWSSSVSLKLGVKTSIQVNSIPLIVEGKVEMSAELSGGFQWGETHTWTKTVESSHTAVVPEMKKAKVRMLATKGRCSVPFRYTQRDLLPIGEAVIAKMEDGVYTGVNYFNVHYETEYQPLT